MDECAVTRMMQAGERPFVSGQRDCMRRTAPSSASRPALVWRELFLLTASLFALACGDADEPEVARLTLDGVRCAPGAAACGSDCVELKWLVGVELNLQGATPCGRRCL